MGGDGFQWPTRRFDTLTHRHTHLHTDTPARVRMKLNKNARNERHENRSREKDERKSEITRPDSSPLLRETRVVGGGWVVAACLGGGKKIQSKFNFQYKWTCPTDGEIDAPGRNPPSIAAGAPPTPSIARPVVPRPHPPPAPATCQLEIHSILVGFFIYLQSLTKKNDVIDFLHK